MDAFLKKKWERVFYTFFDTNGNGFIDWNDFELLFEKIKDIRGPDSQEYKIVSDTFQIVWQGLLHVTKGTDLFAIIDYNQQISVNEWNKFWSTYDPKHMDIWLWEYLKYMFFLMDLTGDKLIDKKEYVELMKMFGFDEPSAGQAFDKFAVASIMIGLLLKLLQFYSMWKSKEKAEEHRKNVALDLNPRPTWWQRHKEQWTRSFMICFCRSDENQWPRESIERMYYSGTQANENLKLLLGYLGAAIMIVILCLFFVFKQPWDPRLIGLICGGLVMLLSYVMFFSSVRCWFLLMIPEFTSTRCRAILILLALGWTLAGPVLNSQLNLQLTAEMVHCVHSQVGEEQQKLKTSVKNLLAQKSAAFRAAMDLIRIAFKRVKDTLQSVLNALNKLVKIIQKAMKWLLDLVGVCNDTTSRPYNSCLYYAKKVDDNCNRYLSFISFVCRWIEMGSNAICFLVKIPTLLCKIPEAIRDQIQKHVLDKLTDTFNKAMRKVEEAFEFEVIFHRNVTHGVETESNATEFKRLVRDEIESIRDKFRWMGGIFDLLIYFVFARLMLSAFWYRRKYLTSPRYDNYFLTEELFKEDLKKSMIGKETALPLTPRETRLYIFIGSCRMTSDEVWSMIGSFITVTISVLFIGFWLIFDYSTWYCLIEQYKLLMEMGGVEVPNFFKLHVQGNGFMSETYKRLLGSTTPETFKDDKNLAKRWQKCIEEPSVPDLELYHNIIIMMLFCYVTVPIGVYLARFRHVICFLFYPEQEIKRAMELQNKILVLRGSWLYFVQKTLTGGKSLPGAIKQRIFVSVPLLGKLVGFLGDEMKTCSTCYEQVKVSDIANYRICENPDCGQAFCINCHFKSPLCQRCGHPKVPKGMIICYEMPRTPEELEKMKAMAVMRGKMKEVIKAKKLGKLPIKKKGKLPSLRKKKAKRSISPKRVLRMRKLKTKRPSVSIKLPPTPPKIIRKIVPVQKSKKVSTTFKKGIKTKKSKQIKSYPPAISTATTTTTASTLPSRLPTFVKRPPKFKQVKKFVSKKSPRSLKDSSSTATTTHSELPSEPTVKRKQPTISPFRKIKKMKTRR